MPNKPIRVDHGEFEAEPIVTAHPYKKGFMIFTAKAVYYTSEIKIKKQVRKKK